RQRRNDSIRSCCIFCRLFCCKSKLPMTNKMTVADALVKELERIGVDTIFGIISIHNIPFYDALQRHGGFRVVTGRHEGAVVNMADANARVRAKLGVALTSTGSGARRAAG